MTVVVLLPIAVAFIVAIQMLDSWLVRRLGGVGSYRDVFLASLFVLLFMILD